MPLTCNRCGKTGDGPPPQRVPFPGKAKEQILSRICEACWKDWEGMEVKVINEYRLNFLDPDHREMLQRACFDFLGLPAET